MKGIHVSYGTLQSLCNHSEAMSSVPEVTFISDKMLLSCCIFLRPSFFIDLSSRLLRATIDFFPLVGIVRLEDSNTLQEPNPNQKSFADALRPATSSQLRGGSSSGILEPQLRTWKTTLEIFNREMRKMSNWRGKPCMVLVRF